MWTITQATADNAAVVLDLMQRFESDTINNTSFRPGLIPDTVEAVEALIETHSAAANAAFFLAWDDDHLIGLLKVAGGQSAFTAHNVHFSIGVDRAYRGKGVGSALMNGLLEWAQANPCVRRVELEVLPRNEGARRLYQRFGFVEEGLRRGAYYLIDEDTFQDAYTMAYITHKG